MPQKIKIIGLVKTDEYIQKEVDAVEGSRLKLLKDSDWTQLMDSPLDPITVLEWRHWRNSVRQIKVSSDSLDGARNLISKLEKSPPSNKPKGPPGYVITKLNYSSVDLFRASCIMVIKELMPSKSVYAKAFAKKAGKLDDYDSIFTAMIEVLKDGY